MRERHGNTRSAFKRLVASDKDYVTKDDCHKLFRNYGYGEVSDRFFDRLDGDSTGGVDYSSFQKVFTKPLDRPDSASTASGQSTYRAAFGG